MGKLINFQQVEMAKASLIFTILSIQENIKMFLQQQKTLLIKPFIQTGVARDV